MAEANTVTGPMKQCESRLTAAEKRVLSLVSLAKTNKEIATALGVSPATGYLRPCRLYTYAL